jgi:type IV pilus assembly protein PilE
MIGQRIPVLAPGPRPARLAGFTLIEMLIVVLIVATLAAIALPAYRNAIIKSNRSAAEQFMSDVSNREEQYLLDQRSYASGSWPGAGGLNTAPTSDVLANYTFVAVTTGNDCNGTAVVAPAYVISATAIGSQASDGNLGNLCLDSRGNKTPTTKWGK